MGIPLLHPWANRLAGAQFSVAGGHVDLDAALPSPSVDASGLPIHGLLAAVGGWRLERHEAQDGGGTLAASFDFADHPELVAAFPFPHELLVEATLSGGTLTVTTTVRASGPTPVPAFLYNSQSSHVFPPACIYHPWRYFAYGCSLAFVPVPGTTYVLNGMPQWWILKWINSKSFW